MKINPATMIDVWLEQNPLQAKAIAEAAIKASCLECDSDTGEGFFNFELRPDLSDFCEAVMIRIRHSTFPASTTCQQQV